MASRVQRNNRWFGLMLVLLIAGGICVIGYWQTYDLKCGGFGTTQAKWTWTKLPPQFVCSGY